MKLFRVIPLTIATAGLFLVVKVADVTQGTEALAEQAATPSATSTTPPAGAEGSPPAAAPAAEAKPEAAPAADAKAAAPADQAKPADAKTEAPAADNKDAKKDEAKTEGKSDKADAGADKKDKTANPAVSEEPGALTDRHFSAVELNLLQNLAKRREDLDRWEQNIQIKEAALNATEKRIDDKIQQIEAMKQEVSGLLAQYNEKEDAKIRSLVKVYENMKAKDAARIFNQMEMPVVLLIIDRMSEKKSAPILAEMDSRKANLITVDLAEKHKFNTAKLNTPAPPAAPPAAPTAQQ